MERCQWLAVALVLAAGALIISLCFLMQNQGGDMDAASMTANLANSRAGADNRSVEHRGFVQTSTGYRELKSLDKIRIVRDVSSDVILSVATPVVGENLGPSIDSVECPYPSGGFTSDDHLYGLSMEVDYDFGLPEDESLLKVGEYRADFRFDEKICRLPKFTPPDIVLEDSPLGPSVRFLPDSAFVRGWLYFQTNGYLRFEPLPDRHPEVSDRLHEYLVDRVRLAYSNTSCQPAMVDGELVETRFSLQVFFRGTDEARAWSNTTRVIISNP